MIFIVDRLARLVTASTLITLTLMAFIYLLHKLREYQLDTPMFWLTFGFTINTAWVVCAVYVQWSELLLFLGAPMNSLQLPFLGLTVIAIAVLSFLPHFGTQPAFPLVALWAFGMQAALWQPGESWKFNFTS